MMSRPSTPTTTYPLPRTLLRPSMDAAVMDAPVMEAPAQDVPAALPTGMPAYGTPATSAPVPEPGAPAAFTAADPLGDFMPPAYRVGGYGDDFDPRRPPYGRTHPIALNAVDPASLTAGLMNARKKPCCTPARPCSSSRCRLRQDPRAHPPHRLPARNPPRDPRPDSRHHLHQQGCRRNA